MERLGSHGNEKWPGFQARVNPNLIPGNPIAAREAGFTAPSNRGTGLSITPNPSCHGRRVPARPEAAPTSPRAPHLRSPLRIWRGPRGWTPAARRPSAGADEGEVSGGGGARLLPAAPRSVDSQKCHYALMSRPAASRSQPRQLLPGLLQLRCKDKKKKTPRKFPKLI